MGSITKTVTENEGVGAKATWTITVNIPDITIRGDTFTFPSGSVTLSKNIPDRDKNCAYGYINIEIDNDDKYSNGYVIYYPTPTSFDWGKNVKTGTYPITPHMGYDFVPRTELFFNQSNPEDREYRFYNRAIKDNIGGSTNVVLMQLTSAPSDGGPYNSSYNNPNYQTPRWENMLTLTLDVPPTYDYSVTSSGPYYRTVTAYTVEISNATAYYGGTIASASLTIGNETATTHGDGTISVTPSEAGTFTPVVSVTDSRGQVSTQELSQITVNQYTAPNITNYAIGRCLQNGEINDEGAYALLGVGFTYFPSVTEIAKPSVKIGDTDATSLTTWYATSGASGVSNPITFPYSASATDAIYGVVNGNFNANSSYQISVSVSDALGSSSSWIEQTLPQAFYTIDFKAGGHGIAFGAPALEDGFKVDMDSLFMDRVFIDLDATEDAQLISLIQALGWNDIVTSISLDQTFITLASGGAQTLVATVTPSTMEVTWSSSDEDVATVSNGLVTAVATGTAIIRASINAGGVLTTATCNVTVS